VRPVVVQDYASAVRALAEARETGTAVRLVSPKDGVAQLGAAFWLALARELGCEITIDASGFPGYALEALRLGARSVLFRGDPGLRRRLDGLARRMGARVYGRLPPAAGGAVQSRSASGRARPRPGAAPSPSSTPAPECEDPS
jgi:hypothetical protein